MSRFLKVPEYRLRDIEYSALRGVDLVSDTRRINKSRASGCVNMYRKYSEGDEFIQTRPGFSLCAHFNLRIYGIHSGVAKGKKRVLVHAGDNIYYWSSFPLAPSQAELTPIYKVKEEYSSCFSYGDKMYFNDGENYLCFDGFTMSPVLGYVPTTRIASTPQGDGEHHQAVNLLSTHRKDSFRGDGISTEYLLDCTHIDGVSSVYVDDRQVLDYTVDNTLGKITFAQAPEQPLLGSDNVVIEFYKLSDEYKKISKCKIAKIFDNRVFFTGNEDYPNRIFHSKLNDPTYIADTDYYDDGSPAYKINAIAISENSITVIKESGENAFYRHTAMTDYSLGRVYPASSIAISCGCDCFNGATVFNDDTVYLSVNGLEGLGQGQSENVYHRSTLVDSAIPAKLKRAMMCCWQNYLCLLINNKIYLADGKARFINGSSFEYEWYIWDDIYTIENSQRSNACYITEQSGNLYFGTQSGAVCVFDESISDMGRDIESYWQSRSETAGSYEQKKTLEKNGCTILLKKIPNSHVRVWCKIDDKPFTQVCQVNMGGLDFANLSFSSLSFSTGADNLIPLNINARSFKTLTLKISSDSCFGIGRINYKARVLNYIK